MSFKIKALKKQLKQAEAQLKQAADRLVEETDPEFVEELADEFGYQAAISVVEMLNEENLDPEDYQYRDGYLGHGSVWVESLNMYGREYGVAPSYEAAYQIAFDRVEDDLKSEPELFNQEWLLHFVDEDHLRKILWDDEYNAIYDDLSYEFDHNPYAALDLVGMDEDDFPSEEALRNYVEEHFEELVEKETKERLRDPLDWLQEVFGKEAALKKAIEWGALDHEKAAESAIDVDGIGHFLSPYDSELHELPSGGAYWRHN
jgi:hypothetical protein